MPTHLKKTFLAVAFIAFTASGYVAGAHHIMNPPAVIDGTEDERVDLMSVCEYHDGIAQGLRLNVPGRIFGVECNDGFGDKINLEEN